MHTNFLASEQWNFCVFIEVLLFRPVRAYWKSTNKTPLNMEPDTLESGHYIHHNGNAAIINIYDRYSVCPVHYRYKKRIFYYEHIQ